MNHYMKHYAAPLNNWQQPATRMVAPAAAVAAWGDDSRKDWSCKGGKEGSWEGHR
jgi:hypothetical protein